VIAVLVSGLKKTPGENAHVPVTLEAVEENGNIVGVSNPDYSLEGKSDDGKFAMLSRNGVQTWWLIAHENSKTKLKEALSVVETADGNVLYNGEPKENGRFYSVGQFEELRYNGKSVEKTGSLGPFKYLSTIANSSVINYKKANISFQGQEVSVWYPKVIEGKKLMKPGMKFKIDKKASMWDRLNFISLMLALFLGTAALPHVLIRYYTVPDQKSARKSTILAIAAIGFFYVLSLFMGFGAMVSGVLDVESSNMAAPLLARSISLILFAIISAIAFATVLGTVSGLIVASSGAIAHDLIANFLKVKLSDKGKVLSGKIAALSVGAIAIGLGILFKGINVSYLVGLAFAVAASANLPAIIMLLFWKRTTSKGIAASVIVGMVTSILIIALSPELFEKSFGLGKAPLPLDNPAIVSVPMSFLTLIVVSFLTAKRTAEADEPVVVELKMVSTEP
jgi:cation/acetate symporter